LGFLGVGWIGRHRLDAIVADGAAQATVLCDPCDEAIASAREKLPHSTVAGSLESLLDHPLDGIVIATPSALHAEQAEAALRRGLAVFCQKPLGRTAGECARVVAAARAADRLLGVDLSYRHTKAMQCVRQLVTSGEIGDVYAVDLVFHNAYGPDKPWFRDARRSGGGCVIDLGIHLVDLALWTLDFPRVNLIQGRLWAKGQRLGPRPQVVEDHALAQLDLATGAVARLACSWNLHAGREAVIEASFHGTKGGARFRNRAGSFYDFTAEHFVGTKSILLAQPPDDWGGRAAVDWARRLASGAGFHTEVEHILEVATVLDGIYDR
jgi:predicted dehydrogenase